MKARVKATGEIGIVANIDILFGCKGYRYQSDEVEIIDSYAEVDTDADSDYWTRLEHQYAGMAVQGILANIDLLMSLAKKKADDYPAKYTVAEFAKDCAHALVENLKEKEERK